MKAFKRGQKVEAVWWELGMQKWMPAIYLGADKSEPPHIVGFDHAPEKLLTVADRDIRQPVTAIKIRMQDWILVPESRQAALFYFVACQVGFDPPLTPRDSEIWVRSGIPYERGFEVPQ